MKCAICDKEVFKNHFKIHLRKEHSIEEKEYYDRYIGHVICENPTCSNEPKFNNIFKGYNRFCCASCANSVTTKLRHEKEPCFGKEKARQTNIEKYGSACNLHSDECIKKKKQTWLIKYGVDHPMKNEQIVEKVINNSIINAGVETREEYYKKREEHIIKTNQERYGVNNVFQSDSIKAKIKNTLLKETGYDNVMKNPEVKNKVKETNFKKTGHYFGISKRYTYDNIPFDSSWELAYYIWLTDNKIDFKYHPEISFKYEFNDIEHSYFPDFLVENKLIEIKSNYLFEKMQNKNTIENAKYECALENNVEFMRNDDIKPILHYINRRYGKNYLKQFQNYK